MIELGPRKLMVETGTELPSVPEGEVLYLDFETTSFDPKQEAFRPYHGHRIAGAALTWESCEKAFYIPVRHRGPGYRTEVDIVQFQAWLKELLGRPGLRWTNHNIKFDAHFAAVEGAEIHPTDCELWDTLTLAKLIDAERFGHSLKPLCRDWLGMDMEEEGRVKAYLDGIGSKDYGDLPADLGGDYACQDVLGNRELKRWLDRHIPEGCEAVWQNELQLTAVLFDCEREGFWCDKDELRIQQAKCLRKMIQCADRLHELTGVEFANSSKGVHEILCGTLGLPVIAYTEPKDKDKYGAGDEVGGPSFAKDVLVEYLSLPQVAGDDKKTEVIKTILAYRAESTFKSLFLESVLEKMDEYGVTHASYNQSVRTGRTSAGDPNPQQFSKRAKKLVRPKPGSGDAIGCSDANQAEFRVIAHYIKDEDIIRQYNENPFTDFHQLVTDMCCENDCEIERSDGKTINFAMGYGAGRARVMSELKSKETIIKSARLAAEAICEKSGADFATTFDQVLSSRVSTVYNTYHRLLPGIKGLSKTAMQNCKARGYTFDLFGRRRNLPAQVSHKAFNSAVQSTIGIFVKMRMKATSPRYWPTARANYVRQIALVHDELATYLPKGLGDDEGFLAEYDVLLRDTSPAKLRVPLTWETGFSEKSWQDAKENGEHRAKERKAAWTTRN